MKTGVNQDEPGTGGTDRASQNMSQKQHQNHRTLTTGQSADGKHASRSC